MEPRNQKEQPREAPGQAPVSRCPIDAAVDATVERDAVLRLLSVDGVGPARVRRLLACFGSAAEALEAPIASLAEALRLPATQVARLVDAARRFDPTAEIQRLHASGGMVVLAGSARFPALLRVAPDPPAALFVRGEIPGDPEPAVAVVGSRRATPYGRLHAARIATELAAQGIVIVSGGARGIDAEAHRGALRAGGRTIAVLAAGLEHPYPPEHAPLFDAIVEGGGAVLTEQLAGVPPRAEFFPRRNRIVAALSLATVVIEAANRSGALVTARIAVEDLSREVGCLPGRVDSAASEGCHRAIREGWARLVTGTEDIVAMLAEARSLAEGAIERMHAGVRGDPAVSTDVPRGRGRRGIRANPEVEAVALRRGEAMLHRGSGSMNSHDPHGSRTGISEDGRTILALLGGPQGSDRGAGAASAADGCAGTAGLDELEVRLGWNLPRIAVATLELERGGWIERDRDGGFRSVRAPAVDARSRSR